jgi:hypothetical protein
MNLHLPTLFTVQPANTKTLQIGVRARLQFVATWRSFPLSCIHVAFQVILAFHDQSHASNFADEYGSIQAGIGVTQHRH